VGRHSKAIELGGSPKLLTTGLTSQRPRGKPGREDCVLVLVLVLVPSLAAEGPAETG
jgi:hypothetical protein